MVLILYNGAQYYAQPLYNPSTNQLIGFQIIGGNLQYQVIPADEAQVIQGNVTPPGGGGGGGGTAGVTSFNGRAGIVLPQAGDYSANQVGADPSGTAASAIAAHLAAGDPHPQYNTAAETTTQINAALSALSIPPASAAANSVFAGPAGGSGVPTFRQLVEADLPAVSRNRPMFLVRRLTGTQALPANTGTVVQFPDEESDLDNVFSSNAFVAPATGLYFFTAFCQFANVVADVQLNLTLSVNNQTSNLNGGKTRRLFAGAIAAAGSGQLSAQGSTAIPLTQGDSVSLIVNPSAALTLDTLANNVISYLLGFRLL